ncbi:MAG TPA: hypothetical protein PK616_03600 [Fibrobacteraceae bacterium]|nr:hypothetical protein [Fibrobacteraceae bacterium]
MESNWKYENNQWTELCWSTEDKQKTYEHEVQHYRNAKKAIEYFYNRHLLTKKNNTATNNLFTQKECIDAGNDLIKKIVDYYNQWEENEKQHRYPGYKEHIPPSPIPTFQNRVPIPCPN